MPGIRPNHDHYFNFRIDFDIDQPINHFSTMNMVPAKVAPDSRRKSLWEVGERMPMTKMEARYKISSLEPKVFHVRNLTRKGYLGHQPGWMIDYGSPRDSTTSRTWRTGR